MALDLETVPERRGWMGPPGPARLELDRSQGLTANGFRSAKQEGLGAFHLDTSQSGAPSCPLNHQSLDMALWARSLQGQALARERLLQVSPVSMA